MANQLPTFDIPGMGRMTAAEFADAYNRGEVPPSLMAPGECVLVATADGRHVVEKGSTLNDPLFCIGAH